MIRKAPAQKTAKAHVEKIIACVKRMSSDLTVLRDEVADLDRYGASVKGMDAAIDRLFLIQRQSWSMREALSEFEEELRSARDLASAPPQLRLTGGR